MVFLRSPFANDPLPQLHHGPVLLRPPLLADFESWVRLRQESKNFLAPWEPLAPNYEFSKFNFRSRIKHYQTQAKNDAAYAFFIFHRDQDHLLGAITASNVRRGAAQMCSVGYWIGKPYARQGYMSHALNALVGHAFNGLSLHRVEAACLPANQASIALLRGCGFSEEGMALKYLNIAGKWQDHLLFAKLSEGR
ncbi:MAG TPA: GNAT family protein [Aestuariivirga sp.]|nr:GNAT family protein [Aestuariivirga sp.]